MADAQPSVASGAFKKPFAEQLAFFKNKLGNLIPTAHWDDISKAAHDTGFMVAGATKADLLTDLAGAVDKAVTNGIGIKAFRADFHATVKKHGWHGWTGEGTKAGEAWRTLIIYQTNASTSYAAGRLAQLREGGFPIWIYHHSDSVTHPRPWHLAWNGLTLSKDDSFWATHYAPNGWRCGCYISGARSTAGARRLGGDPSKAIPAGTDAIDKKTGAPVGIDKGWDYTPGDTVSDTVTALAKKTATLPPRIAVAFGNSIASQIAVGYEQWIQSVLSDRISRGRTTVLASMGAKELDYLESIGRPPERADISLDDRLVVGKKAVRHAAAGDALTDAEWQSLGQSMRGSRTVLYDNDSGNVLYVLPSETNDKIKVVVKPDYWDKKAKATAPSSRSIFKIDAEALKDARKYTVIDGKIK